MTKKLDTIVDNKGDVWTGKSVSTSSGADLIFGLMTCGLSLATSKPKCVEVNGDKHYGKSVKSNS